MTANDPYMLKATLHKAKKFAVDYAEAAFRAGLDVIAFVDPLANGDFLSYQQYQEFPFHFYRKICEETKRLGILVILHVCGNTTKILPLVFQGGADEISIESSVDVLFANDLLSGRSAVIGNVSTTKILLHGTEDKVWACPAECIAEGVDAVAPGCGLVQQTSLNNLRAMVETTFRFRGGRLR